MCPPDPSPPAALRTLRLVARREGQARRRGDRAPDAREASALGRAADRAPRGRPTPKRKKSEGNFPACSLLKTIKTELESIRWAGRRNEATGAARPSAQTILLVGPRISRLREAEERAPIGIHQQALADGQGARENDAAQRLVGLVDRVELHIGGIGERLARGGVEFGRRSRLGVDRLLDLVLH